MTRKDYILIAKVFNAYIADDGVIDLTPDVRTHARAISRALAWELEKENPRFDMAKFLVACGHELK